MAAATGTNHRRLGEHRDIRGRVEQVARDIAIGVVPVVLLLVGHGINRPGAYSQTRGGGGEERGSVCGVNEGARGGGGASSNGGGDWCPRVWNLGFRDLLDF